MEYTAQKELQAVVYNDGAVKFLPFIVKKSDSLCFKIHWHERLEFLFIESGALKLTLGESVITVNKGQLAIINSRQLHGGFSLEDGVKYKTVMFEMASFFNNAPLTEKVLKPIESGKIHFCNITENEEVLLAFKNLMLKENFDDEYSPLLTYSAVYELIAALCKNCLKDNIQPSAQDSKYRDIIDFINENYKDDISSKSISAKFGYDEAYFCRLFKSITGFSPMEYIKILRLEHAKKLIAAGNCTISEAALSSGFSDSGYFSRCFKKYYKTTPKTKKPKG